MISVSWWDRIIQAAWACSLCNTTQPQSLLFLSALNWSWIEVIVCIKENPLTGVQEATGRGGNNCSVFHFSFLRILTAPWISRKNILGQTHKKIFVFVRMAILVYNWGHGVWCQGETWGWDLGPRFFFFFFIYFLSLFVVVSAFLSITFISSFLFPSSFVSILFWNEVSCHLGLLGTQYVDMAVDKFLILLSQLPKCWDCYHIPSHLTRVPFLMHLWYTRHCINEFTYIQNQEIDIDVIILKGRKLRFHCLLIMTKWTKAMLSRLRSEIKQHMDWSLSSLSVL